MKIRIHDIGADGKHIATAAPKDSWLAETLAQGLAELYRPGETAHLVLDLLRIGETLQVDGTLSLDIHPVCARCAESFTLPFQVPVKRILMPRPAPPLSVRSKGEDELDAEDLDFSFYEGDELDIDPIFIEETLLALPLVFLCRPDCRGLCQRCGANLNAGLCGCAAL